MPLLALIVTDQHNAEALFLALPPGAVYTIVTLTKAEWAKSPDQIASEYGIPIVARSQQEWAKQRHP